MVNFLFFHVTSLFDELPFGDGNKTEFAPAAIIIAPAEHKALKNFV